MIRIGICQIAIALTVIATPALAAGEPATAPDGLADCASIFTPIGMPSGRDGADEHEFAFANGFQPLPLPASAQDGTPSDASRVSEVQRFRYKCYKKSFAVRLNAVTRVPDWVAEDITAEEIDGTANRSNNFFEDTEVAAFASHLTDYSASGFDRGHQAPAGDFNADQEVKDETFVMSNMGPQVGACFNRGIWKNLETAVRDLVRTRGRLIVFTGPIYNGELTTIGDLVKKKKGVNVAVPDAFFKIVYAPEDMRAMAVEITNKAHCNQSYQEDEFLTSINDIEQKTGFTFFPELSTREQKLLKSQKSVGWTW